MKRTINQYLYRIKEKIKLTNKKQRFITVGGITLFFIVSVLVLLSKNTYKIALLLSFLMFFLNSFFIFKKRKKILFNPIYLFSIYYLTISFTIWYLVLTNFSTNLYVNNTSYNGDFVSLFTLSVFYYLIGFIACIVGYYAIDIEEKPLEIIFENKQKISDIAINIVLILFFTIGIFNFIINVIYFSNGNIIHYFGNISKRTQEFAQWGTTFGYQFLELAIYVWFYKLLRNNKKINIYFIIGILIFFFIKLSEGRIFGTISILGVLACIYYFCEYSKEKKVNNKKYFIFIIGLVVLAIIIYFFRLMSNYIAIGKVNNIYDGLQLFVKQFGYYAVDRGNTPNIAIMPKIIDAWNSDIGFLWGKSFLCFLFSFINIGFPHTSLMTSVMIKDTWYLSVEGGKLPATVVGEMYANFGPLGVIFGMFIFGVLIALLYKYLFKTKNYFFLVVCSKVFVMFIMLSPKVDSSNFTLWLFIPVALTYLSLRVITKIIIYLQKTKCRKVKTNSSS